MRFCPFCSAENAEEATTCATCSRRLPPLPPRRAARNAPPTGVQLPPRTKPPSNPPATRAPIASASPSASSIGAVPAPIASPPSAPTAVPTAMPATNTAPMGSGPRAARPSQAPPLAAQAPPLAPPSTPPPSTTPTSPGMVTARAARPSQGPPLAPQANARPKGTTQPPPMPKAATGFDDDFNTVPSASAYASPESAGTRNDADASRRSIDAGSSPLAKLTAPRAPLPPPVVEPVTVGSTRLQTPTGVEPPATRIQRPEQLADRPFTPPKVDPVPEIPEPGLLNAARYAVRFWRARFQRRGAIKTLGADIKQDTEALDQVLGALGRAARSAKIDGRVFSAENQAITAAEERAFMLSQEHGDVDGRKAEENSKFLDVEKERIQKLDEAQRAVDETQKELSSFEGQRRGLRDKRKELERRQKAYIKAAEDAERQAGQAQMGDSRTELRRSAEDHRKEAAALEPERQDIDRRIAALERPINEATARLDAAKAELDAAKRSLADAREGHNHRLAELDAEQKRKSREISLAEAEIARRLVTLGTLVNLNRIDDPQFFELYQRIDRLRGAITARTTEIEKLTAEREAFDRGTMVRGYATIGGALVIFIALIVILRAVL